MTDSSSSKPQIFTVEGKSYTLGKELDSLPLDGSLWVSSNVVGKVENGVMYLRDAFGWCRNSMTSLVPYALVPYSVDSRSGKDLKRWLVENPMEEVECGTTRLRWNLEEVEFQLRVKRWDFGVWVAVHNGWEWESSYPVRGYW